MMMVWSASGSLVFNKMSGCPPRPVSPHHCPGHPGGTSGARWHQCDKFISPMGNIGQSRGAGRMGTGVGTRGDPLSIWHNDRLHKTSLIQRLQTEGPVLVTNVTQLLCKQQTLNYLSKPDIGLDHYALINQDYLQLQYLFFSIFVLEVSSYGQQGRFG